ncbi:CMRF35-like molecule 8 isoform X2 [Chelmon rostratus]|uniref:CMRF35-like molecule 8 isoform X2 n=1 Tax=Chelmon rostratus TaxID=109905 RepID=UPI001BEC03FA|nr:CMRF35-like molecule 8 isoform X2 [Chelmon rostratus]
MGATWISWRTTTTVIITILQIQALISVKTKAVTGVEGQMFDFRCDYQDGQQSNAKYFCHVDENVSSGHLIRTEKHNQWVRNGRFSLYDNTTGAFFVVRVDKLISEDRGTYWCGVDISLQVDDIRAIQLNVSRATASTIFQKDLTVDKLNLPLYLTAAMCVAAILSVCFFTLCLLLAVKHRRSGTRQNRETSSDYETMTPGVRTEPELRCSCSCSDCADLSSLPAPPPDPWSHYTSKHWVSEDTPAHGEYVDVDVPRHICQYQHLDFSRLEEHIYHSLNGNRGPKDGPPGVREQIDC